MPPESDRSDRRPKAPAMDGTSADMWGDAVKTPVSGRGAWLRDSRFALFIHWGLYSLLAGRWRGKPYFGISEWIMNRARIPAADYAGIAARFNPTDFDARAWVRLARQAGMRHIMITAKHHDGFAMFHSRASRFNIVEATPFGRDPLAELAEACRHEGLRLGFYYSQTADWHEADAVGNTWDFPEPGNFTRYLHEKALPQIEELLTGYGPVAGMWFDTPGPITPEQSSDIVQMVHRLQPDCLVNSRIGNGLGDYDTLGDQEVPHAVRRGLWETIDTINDSWGYSQDDVNWKSPRTVAARLAQAAGCGGTYMLNVGPDGTGRIPEASACILREVGRWVHDHPRAIHGTGSNPLAPLPWGQCTATETALHLHVFRPPPDGRLVVPGVVSPIGAVRLDGRDLPVRRLGVDLIVELPHRLSDRLIPVVEVPLDGPLHARRDPAILPGCRNLLHAGTAELAGCEAFVVRWMEKFGDWKHAECLGQWRGEAPLATWTARTVEPGRFVLEVKYTCPEAADLSHWRVQLNDTTLDFPLIDTGERGHRAAFGWSDLPRFRACRIGLVELPGQAPCRVTLRPMDPQGAPVRVAALHLVPAGDTLDV